MGIKNYLVEGVSCTGKTSVCNELQRRGYHSIHGDNELAYWGDPKTGEPLDSSAYEHWIWDVAKVRAIVADRRSYCTVPPDSNSHSTSGFVCPCPLDGRTMKPKTANVRETESEIFMT